ncbi:sulfatase family protein [Labilibacter marinus]|uniref:sulfatase family protein n=1 Tax=Labilibacter marinus TaxID=1477105 RepID=UPI00082EF732|nr:sulfatase [Labilibacter marinus]
MYKLLIIPLVIILFSCSQTKIKKQPNIIFIMSDDHAAQAIGAYNGFYSALNPTPNIDQLAADGMLFNSAFCTNSICTPSRASIITGQYPQTNGILDLDGALDTAKQYLPIELKKLGYTTAIIGKWHLKNEPTHFDFYKVLPGQGKYFNPTFRKKGLGKWPDNKVKTEGHSSDVITNSTLNYLKRVDKSKPFFIMHHYKAPHGKFEFAPRYTDYLESTKVPEPASLYTQPNWGSIATKGKDNKLKDKVGSSVSARHFKTAYVDQYVNDSSLTDYEATSRAYQTYLKDYLRCVKGIDDNLGRLFICLKEEGLWDNTIIVYTADQGFMLGAHDLIDKRWMYEESMQMPFIIHCPEMIDKGIVSDLLINNTDFAPTIIELAGGKAPNYMQGKSFIKTIKGKEEKNWRTTTYYRYWMHMIHHYVPAHLGIRSKDYKLILYYNKHYLAKNERNNFYWSKRYSDVMDEEIPVAWEFYDLKNDPQELNNKYNDPNYATIIHDMKEDLKQQRIELNETDKNYPALNNIIEQHWND